MSQNMIQIIKTKTDGLWKGEYQLLSQQLLWLKVSLLASQVECNIFSTRHPPPPRANVGENPVHSNHLTHKCSDEDKDATFC